MSRQQHFQEYGNGGFTQNNSQVTDSLLPFLFEYLQISLKSVEPKLHCTKSHFSNIVCTPHKVKLIYYSSFKANL